MKRNSIRPLTSGLCLLLAAIGFFTGCAGISKTAKLAGYAGTSAALRQHPEWRPHFVTAELDLAALEASETIDVVNVLAIMNRLPVDKLNSADAVIIITTATITIQEFGGGAVSLNEVQTAEVKAFVHKLREGIKLALTQTPAN